MLSGYGDKLSVFIPTSLFSAQKWPVHYLPSWHLFPMSYVRSCHLRRLKLVNSFSCEAIAELKLLSA